ncbi:MAG: hypothetical protein GXP54_02295 [Deltaproteobacteria bacterium]|nr:hypothetical protein [Deltaproteobacteria bacterium]
MKGPFSRPGWGLVFAAAIVLVLVTPQHYRNDVHPANESARVYAALAIVQYGTLRLDPVFDRYFPRWRSGSAPPNTDASMVDGHYVLDKAPGVTLVAVPVLAALDACGLDPGAPDAFAWVTWLLTLIISALPSAVLAVVLGRRLGRWGQPAFGWLVAVACVLATHWLAYGGLLFGHALAASLIGLGSLMTLGPIKAGRLDQRMQAFSGGLLLGYAVITEYPTAAIVLAVGLALLADHERRNRLFWVVMGGLGPAIILLLWNTAAFGDPFQISYGFKTNTLQASIIAHGVFGIGAPSLERLSALLFGAKRGLFFVAPWLFMGFVGTFAIVRNQRIALCWRVAVAATVIGFPVLISGFVDWTAGNSMGPRHLLPILPALAVATVSWLSLDDSPRRVAWRGIVAGLAVSSLLVCTVGAWVFPYFDPSVANPIFEVNLPILLDTGFGRTSWDPTGGLLGFVLGLAVIVALAAGVMRNRSKFRIAAFVIALALPILHVATGTLPMTTGQDAGRVVLRERALVYEMNGYDEKASEIRKNLKGRAP